MRKTCCERNNVLDCNQGRNCPERTCDALGVCQVREPRCTGCTAQDTSPAEDVFNLIAAVIYAAIVLLIIAAVSMSAGVLFGGFFK